MNVPPLLWKRFSLECECEWDDDEEQLGQCFFLHFIHTDCASQKKTLEYMHACMNAYVCTYSMYMHIFTWSTKSKYIHRYIHTPGTIITMYSSTSMYSESTTYNTTKFAYVCLKTSQERNGAVKR